MSRELPPDAYLKDLSARYNDKTIPRRFRATSHLAPQMWGRVVMEEGELFLYLGPDATPLRCTRERPGVIPPDTAFKLADTGRPAQFVIEYYHEPRLVNAEELVGMLTKGAIGRHASA